MRTCCPASRYLPPSHRIPINPQASQYFPSFLMPALKNIAAIAKGMSITFMDCARVGGVQVLAQSEMEKRPWSAPFSPRTQSASASPPPGGGDAPELEKQQLRSRRPPFAIRSLRYLNGRTLSPFPTEAEYSGQQSHSRGASGQPQRLNQTRANGIPLSESISQRHAAHHQLAAVAIDLCPFGNPFVQALPEFYLGDNG